jgi:hypothetical protein
VLSFKLFLEADKKENKTPDWFYVSIYLTKDLISGPSKSAFSGTAATLTNVEGITESETLLKGGFETGMILKMPGKETLKLNKLSKIQYNNPDYLISKGLRAIKRISSGVSSYGRTIFGYVTNILNKLFTNLAKLYNKHFIYYDYYYSLKKKDFIEGSEKKQGNSSEVRKTLVTHQEFYKNLIETKIKEIKEINNVRDARFKIWVDIFNFK